MKKYCGVAVENIKFASNAGGILRAADCFNIDAVMFQGKRIAKNSLRTDTRKSYRNVPTQWVDSITERRPLGVEMVSVDLVDDAENLVDFVHPERALYVFGPEDGTLGSKILRQSTHKIYIPTSFCMNLASCVNVVLYDRLQKETRL